jgi:type I restriction enzyme S subunit
VKAMTGIETILTENLDIWTSAIERKNGAGRGRSKKVSFYGIEKLRALILELAVRGKLVPQDPGDEPASELLKQFHSERDEWVAKKRMRKGKRLPRVQGDEERFPSPEGWLWIRLNDVGDWGAGATPNRKYMEYYDGEMPWFKSGELSSDYISESEETVTELALEQCSLRINRPGDVLIAMYGATIGKASILEVEATTNQAVCACTPFRGVNNRYLLLTLKAMRPVFIGQGAGGAQPNISREKIISTPIALPPFVEQKRIVAKVDELMALCDTLEAETSEAIEAHQMLVEQLLATLTNSRDAKELAQNWARIEEHFDILFTTEDSVDQLKQTILQLAVMGKLVPQDPNDEPASELLMRIKHEKSELIASGKIKKSKPLPPIKGDGPFTLPDSWAWCHPDEFANKITDGEHFRPETQDHGVYFLSAKDIRENGVSLEEPLFVSEEVADKARSRCDPEYNDLLIVSRGATCGRTCRVDIDEIFCLLGSVVLIKPSRHISSEYLEIALKSPFLQLGLISASGATAQGAIYLRDLKKIAFPMAPYSEQMRISKRVKELMALCDALKDRLQRANEQRVHFANTVVAKAVS